MGPEQGSAGSRGAHGAWAGAPVRTEFSEADCGPAAAIPSRAVPPGWLREAGTSSGGFPHQRPGRAGHAVRRGRRGPTALGPPEATSSLRPENAPGAPGMDEDAARGGDGFAHGVGWKPALEMDI